MAKKIVFTKAELDKFQRMIATWKNDDSDEDLRKVYQDDRRQMTGVLRLLRNGNLKGAATKINSLDSIIRDQIPKTIYDKIYPDEVSEDGRFIRTWRITLRDGEEVETHMSLHGIEAQYGDRIENLERIRWTA